MSEKLEAPDAQHPAEVEAARRGSIAQTEKGRWERLWPVIACGAGLFSDGYLNNVRTDSQTRRSRPPIGDKIIGGNRTDNGDRLSAP